MTTVMHVFSKILGATKDGQFLPSNDVLPENWKYGKTWTRLFIGISLTSNHVNTMGVGLFEQ